ncbi:PadR family transcriptional regulator [Jatrophihabitans sp. YIM 134969]
MATGHVLLGLLARGERHGYELKRQYDSRFPAAKPLAFGQVYAALDALARRGLVEAAVVEKAGAAERTSFRMTAGGRAELDRWLAEVEPPAQHAGNPFQLKVTLALLAADEAVAASYLRAQRSAHLARMRHFVRLTSDPDAPLAEVLAADYALTHLEADLRWLEAAETRVGDLARELEETP